jgi:hypothetical protein
MKKLLLMISCGAFAVSSVLAQGTSETNATSTGHTYVGPWADCMLERSFAGGVSGKTDVVTIDATAKAIKITAVGDQPAFSRPATYIALIDKDLITYSPTNCSGALSTINVTSATSKLLKVTGYATSNVTVRLLVGSGSPICSNNNVTELIERNFTTTSQTFTIDLSTTGILASTCAPGSVYNINAITHIGINPDVPGGAFAGSIYIEKIELGDAPVVSGIKAAVDNSLISVYPNPANDKLTVDLAKLNGAKATVKVMNTLGDVMIEEATSDIEHSMSLSSLEKGMYLVQVSSGNKISNKKIVVQ